MDTLMGYFDEKELLDVLEINPEIKDMEDEEIERMIDILKRLKCSPSTISDAIYANPFYLTNIESDIIDIVNTLISIGITDFDEILQGNPWILDRDPAEIKKFLLEERKKGTSVLDILEKIERGEME